VRNGTVRYRESTVLVNQQVTVSTAVTAVYVGRGYTHREHWDSLLGTGYNPIHTIRVLSLYEYK